MQPICLKGTFDDSGGVTWNSATNELLFTVNQINHIRRWRPTVPIAMNFDIVRKGGENMDGTRGLDFAPDGSLVVCETLSRRVTRSSNSYNQPVTLTERWPSGGAASAGKSHSPHHVVVRKDGNIYFTDLGVDSIFRIDPAGQISVAADTWPVNFKNPLGIALSADHNTLFISLDHEKALPGIFKFAIQSDGSLGPHSVFFKEKTYNATGIGGLCTDVAGNVYHAAGVIKVYRHDGTPLNVSLHPKSGGSDVWGASDCAFGGSDLKTLFVTAAGGASDKYNCNLWMAQVDIQGVR
jgi:gluconolactonase